ncbi:Cyclic nucleotide-binding domain-containing protein [Chitinophaga sp. YR627]|uniref:ATP-binding protein n=1 Tax=Chitinophaga sp. YR627 TaxID=1881041 RepID=UPI0008EBC83A|nr:ATP-binding protein [Chitinophaga sp. YR627]SFO01186.1 Cyclic nucleotide-binding domain-containing protein [Chitinophaga sp. YR627]
MTNITVEWMRSIESLTGVPDNQLQWFIDNSERRELAAGSYAFNVGDAMIGTHVLLSGRIKICQMQNNELRELMIAEPGRILGYLPFSRGMTSSVAGEAIDDIVLYTLPMDKIEPMIRNHFEITQALVHIMTNRVRDYTSFIRQSEKMMALGKLSAGLAHELNNPAAAVVRGAHSMKKHLQLQPEFFKKIMEIRMDEASINLVKEKMFEILSQHNIHKSQLTLVQRSQLEDELTDWLDDLDVENSAELAENFVEFGFTLEHLDQFRQRLVEKDVSPIFNWINNNLITEKIVSDIEEASKRIADLVGSVKSFTHMDQGYDKQLTNIHDGIRTTISILQYKIRKGNIELVEDYDTNLPPLRALIGELNQVWTNIIDNALDAMEVNKKGKLFIKTERDKDCLKVIITDDGPGIPEHVLERVFDPFFTTKEPGKGTGLGLDIVSQIVRQHKGYLKAESRPGETKFIVSLPILG